MFHVRVRLPWRDPAAHLDRPARRSALLRKRRRPDRSDRAEGRHAALMPELPDQWEVAPEPGWIDPALAHEFPGLSIASTVIEATSGRSPQALKERLGR